VAAYIGSVLGDVRMSHCSGVWLCDCVTAPKHVGAILM